MDERPVEYDDLADNLIGYEIDQPFVIRMDKKANFEHFVKIIDELKKGNFNELSIQANKEQ